MALDRVNQGEVGRPLMTHKSTQIFDSPQPGTQVLGDSKKYIYAREVQDSATYYSRSQTLVIETSAVSNDQKYSQPNIYVDGITVSEDGKSSITVGLRADSSQPSAAGKIMQVGNEVKTISIRETFTGKVTDYTPEEYKEKHFPDHKKTTPVRGMPDAMEILTDNKEQNEMPAIREVVKNYKLTPEEIASGMTKDGKLNADLVSRVDGLTHSKAYVPDDVADKLTSAIKEFKDRSVIGDAVGKALAASIPLDRTTEVANGTNVHPPASAKVAATTPTLPSQ